ncbi:MAG: hypothetical protein FWD31_01465 [Planctomycetaceae bacterium]|nr:hypothetical protein [Planctomycetaceae bacterium]
MSNFCPHCGCEHEKKGCHDNDASVSVCPTSGLPLIESQTETNEYSHVDWNEFNKAFEKRNEFVFSFIAVSIFAVLFVVLMLFVIIHGVITNELLNDMTVGAIISDVFHKALRPAFLLTVLVSAPIYFVIVPLTLFFDLLFRGKFRTISKGKRPGWGTRLMGWGTRWMRIRLMILLLLGFVVIVGFFVYWNL